MAAATPLPAAAFVAGRVKPEEEEEAVVRLKEEAAAAAQDDAPAALPPYPPPTAALPPCPRRKRAAPAPEGAPGACAVDRRKSKVWHYYSKLGDAFVECRVCRKQLSFHNSTTTMREHLVRKHGIRDTQPPEDTGAPLEPAGKRARPVADAGCGPAAAERSEVIAELVLEMVFRDLRPLAAVEDGGFGQLLAFLEPGLALPAPARLADMLGQRYGAVRRQVERYLQAAPSVVVCAEAWATQSDRPYVTLTATFVDEEWRRARCTLATQPVSREGGWAQELGAVLAKFGLSGQCVSWVLREGGGGGSAGWRERGCAAGALQRCVGAGLEVEQVRDALSVARGIVGYFQRDAKAAGCLQSKLEAINKTKVKLAPDTAWRWLTTAEMCENLLELKWAVLSALEERPKAVQSLAEHQWKLLQELVPVLRTLKLATAFLSEEQNVSASALLPCVHGVAAAIGQQAEGAGAAVKAVVGTIRAELARCWGLAAAAEEEEEEALLENPAVVAAFLDPRFKELRFLSPGLRVELHRRVKAMLSQGAHPPATAPALLCRSEPQPRGEGDPHKERCSPQSVYDVLLGKDPTEDMPEIHQQLENYVVEPLCKRSTNPLHWWKSNERRFPAVAQLGRRYLALPATAVPPERAFATCQSMLEQRRPGLAPENLDQILFLHQNSDFWEALRGGPEARGRTLH